MANTSNRLKEARIRAGFRSAREASTLFGWSIDTYKSHENGIRNPKVADLKGYAKAYRVTVEWLLLGSSPPAWTNAPGTTPPRILTRLAPELPWSQVARYVGQRPSMEGVNVLSEREIEAERTTGAGTFWLRLIDDAMSATAGGVSFAAGDMVAFDPDAAIKPGDFVLAIADDGGEPVFRKAQFRGGDAYDLQPLNPDS